MKNTKVNKEESKDSTEKELYFEINNPKIRVSKWAKLTEWVEVFFCGGKDHPEKDLWAICICDWFDDEWSIIKQKDLKFAKNGTLKDLKSNVIRFGKCSDHFYHKGCAEALMGTKEYVKWAVWFAIYGEYTGEMPSGKMEWEFFPKGNYPLDTYEYCGTWIINYIFLLLNY